MTENAALATVAPADRLAHPTLAGLLRLVVVCAIVVGLLRIVATYSLMSQTFDEPAHIAAGMQLLDKGIFEYEELHPPLARIAAAVGPFLAGYRSQGGGDMWIEGRRLFSGAKSYDEFLTWARFGTLPFFILVVAIVAVWGARSFDPMTGALAALLVSSQPVLLGHAGLATTDAPFAGTFTAALFAWIAWLERPSRWRSVALGVALALAVTTKLSAMLFLPAACGTIVLYRWYAEHGRWSVPRFAVKEWRHAPLIGGAAGATIWLVYGCSADPLDGFKELALGIRDLVAFSADGAPSYFLGEIRSHGWWTFFPVLLLVRTPLPFLLAVGYGVAVMVRHDRADWRRMAPLVAATAMLAAVLPSPINIGLRHILPIYGLLGIVAARGLAHLLDRVRLGGPGPLAAALVLGGHIACSLAAHPDYLAYFNALAGEEPERIVVGSDLDWGQDVRRLAETLAERHIERPSIAVHTSADIRRQGIPDFNLLYPYERATGWVAISAEMRQFYCAGYRWLDAYPVVERIGRSIKLYHIPADGGAADVPQSGPPAGFRWDRPLPCGAR
jgi:hypothetical protein